MVTSSDIDARRRHMTPRAPTCAASVDETLHTVTSRDVPLHTVTYRYIPLRAHLRRERGRAPLMQRRLLARVQRAQLPGERPAAVTSWWFRDERDPYAPCLACSARTPSRRVVRQLRLSGSEASSS